MRKGVISNKQLQLLAFTYILGPFLIFGIGGDLKQDAWIATILALVLSIPIVIIYGKLMNLYPEKNIFNILEISFGKVFGKILSILVIFHVFLLGAYILNDFADFTKLTALFYTPKFIPMLIIGTLSIWILNAGIEVLANWVEFFIRGILIFIFVIWILLIPQMNAANLQPVFESSLCKISTESLKIVALPFSELMVFLNFCDCVKCNKNTCIFVKPLIAAGAIVIIGIIVQIMLLGGEIYSTKYYPSYAAIRRIVFKGDFQRLEIIASVAFTITQFIEFSLCVLGVSKGIQSVFNLENYKYILVPTIFLVINFSYLMFRSVMEANEFLNLWAVYQIAMQVLFPSIILIVSLIKKGHFSRLH
ncbi:endospore germination permease [Clostridium sp. KNHs214]|uniref:GerAB/ArcD/ProY family transporter n=1 Tax=Clostridium sp. KNHs214 TaxID=1540257 RepID=UPI0005533D64|nr:endospore germination permease [Clostridium sp. KNHs214]